jgi:hypothetical protein
MSEQELYTYGFRAEGQLQHIHYQDLSSALFAAICGFRGAHGQSTPLGIRQGDRVLFRHSDLLELYERFAERLAEGDDWAVIIALQQLTGELDDHAAASYPRCHHQLLPIQS